MKVDELVPQDHAHLVHITGVRPERVVHGREHNVPLDALVCRLHHVGRVD